MGAENVTVLVLDETRRDQVLRTFESMVGLREGTLDSPAGPANRSLTLEEAETIRAFNIEARARDMPGDVTLSVMFQGAAPFLKEREPAPEATRIELPQWAISDTAAVSRAIADGIAESGVRVVGDLDALTWVPRSGPRAAVATRGVEPRLAALVTVGALIGGGLVPERSRAPGGDRKRMDPATARTHRARTEIGSERRMLGQRRARILAKALVRVTKERIAHRRRAGYWREWQSLPWNPLRTGRRAGPRRKQGGR